MERLVLGSSGKEVLNHLEQKENVLVGGISGVGTTTLARNISKVLEDKGYLVVQIFSFDARLDDISQIDALVSESVPDSKSLFRYVKSQQNSKVLVVLNKVDQFQNIELWYQYLDTLRKSTMYKVVILATSHLPYFESVQSFLEYQKIRFKGFGTDYSSLMDNLTDYFDMKPIDENTKSQALKYTLGHAGLTKALVYEYKNSGDISNLNVLLKNKDIQNRLAKIFSDLNDLNVDITDFGSISSFEKYEMYGLVKNLEYAKLPLYYYESNIKHSESVEDSLTPVERDIYLLLKSNYHKYTSIDQIISYVNKPDFEEVTTWTVYKHINNLEKKLAPYDIYIENKRSVGYRLQS